MNITQTFWGKTLAISLLGMVVALGLMISTAGAHTDPPACFATGPSLLLIVYRADGVTPVGGGSVTPGETIKYEAMLTHGGPPQCNYGGGTLSITTPDGPTDVTGGLGAATISFGFPFTSAQVSYVVDSAEVGGDGDIDASATYAGGTSHSGGGDVSPVGATTPAATPFVKLDSVVTTEVHAPPHVDITGGTVAAGTTVHDEATVTGTVAGGTPTGSATIVFFGNGVCEFGGFFDGGLYPLVGGVAESIGYPAFPPGSYSFLASYGGDANYNGGVGICEPFTIVEPLHIEKTAVTSYDREWDWTIDKSADKTNLLLAEGESFTVNYDVTVNATSTDINHVVSGMITIANPPGNPPVLITSVTDVLNISGPTIVVCVPPIPPPFLLLPGGVLICTYSLAVAGPVDSENTVTVETEGPIPGGVAGAPVVWGAPTNEIDECINVSDTNDTDEVLPDTICANEALPHTYEYGLTFGPAGGEGVEVQTQCGEDDHPNTASFVTNDTGTQGQDSENVHWTVNCFVGCTLTQGYWKTHNDSFKGGAPTDDNWDNITTLAELTGFFTNIAPFYPVLGPNVPPFTWFSVFWTAPKGNAYYNLAHQYMAAKLNILNSASTTPAVDAAITAAEDFFDTYTPASFSALGKKHVLRGQVIGWAGTLGSYNEGSIGPGHCDEQNPPI